MKIVVTVARILLGLMMLVFGLNKFFHFIPMEPPVAEEALAYMAVIVGSYIGTVIAVVEIVTGLMLLINKYLALAAVLVFPVMLNAFLYHITLDPANSAGAILALLFNIILLWDKKESYQGMLIA
jgi:putative oxidoreductase